MKMEVCNFGEIFHRFAIILNCYANISFAQLETIFSPQISHFSTTPLSLSLSPHMALVCEATNNKCADLRQVQLLLICVRVWINKYPKPITHKPVVALVVWQFIMLSLIREGFA